MKKKELKHLLAGLSAGGAIIGFLDNVIFPYHYLRVDGAGNNFPEIMRTMGWIMITVPPLLYFMIDLIISRKD